MGLITASLWCLRFSSLGIRQPSKNNWTWQGHIQKIVVDMFRISLQEVSYLFSKSISTQSLKSPKHVLKSSSTPTPNPPENLPPNALQTSQTSSKHLPTNYQTCSKNNACLNFRLRMKDLRIFALRNEILCKTTTPMGDLQTPGIEDLVQHTEFRTVVKTTVFVLECLVQACQGTRMKRMNHPNNPFSSWSLGLLGWKLCFLIFA